LRARKHKITCRMKHAIRITAVRKDPPDLERFVAALLAFAIERVEAERELRASEKATQSKDHHE
jgi:hypothetical protein